MSSAPTSNHPQNSLPPLHQAIPEFHSHNPHERRSSSVPRKLAERSSPSLGHPPQRTSPVSSNGYHDTSNGSDNADAYDAQANMFPGRLDARRAGSLASGSPYGVETRPSPYLPPVSSLASSRGSSLDMDPIERPGGSSHYNSQPPNHPYPSSLPFDHHSRSHPPHHPDYRYPPNSAGFSPPTYRSTSPGPRYPQPHYYPNSDPYAPHHRPSQHSPIDGQSPFSSPGDLSVDHFEQRPGKRRRGNLPKQVTDLLRSWLNDHLHHPYPTEDEKQMLMAQTGLTIHQISNWFINARRRRIPAITSSDPGRSGAMRRPSASH